MLNSELENMLTMEKAQVLEIAWGKF